MDKTGRKMQHMEDEEDMGGEDTEEDLVVVNSEESPALVAVQSQVNNLVNWMKEIKDLILSTHGSPCSNHPHPPAHLILRCNL
jgi:hypothetical protein